MNNYEICVSDGSQPQSGMGMFRIYRAVGRRVLQQHTGELMVDASLVDAEKANFIAHARTDIPLLIAEVERLRAMLAKLEDSPLRYEVQEVLSHD